MGHGQRRTSIGRRWNAASDIVMLCEEYQQGKVGKEDCNGNWVNEEVRRGRSKDVKVDQ